MVPIWKKCLWNLHKVGINNEILDILKQYLDSPYEELNNIKIKQNIKKLIIK